ncbi:MAG: hypothetical protein P8J37_18350 [Fuerstiella sp.]|nr:hypothetical protein [Fuerstiella sp.]
MSLVESSEACPKRQTAGRRESPFLLIMPQFDCGGRFPETIVVSSAVTQVG